MTLKEKIALGQLNKELARGIISQKEYDLKLKKLQGQTVDPKAEIKAQAATFVEHAFKKAKSRKLQEVRTERVDTDRVAAKKEKTGQSSD